MSDKQTTQHGRKRGLRYGLLAAIALLVVAVAATAWVNPFGGAGEDHTTPTFTVQQGSLTISVTESGTIEARDQVILSSEVEGQNTLIYLVPEGTEVQQDDLVAELDASRFEEQRVSQQISVQNAEANLIRAEETLEVTQSQGESDVDVAKLTFEFARQDLENYIEGEYPKQETEMRSRITLAESELKQAEDRLEWSRRLLDEKYISQNDYESDALTVERRRLDLALAREDLNLLQVYTRPRRLAELESDLEQAERSLERTRRRARADVVQAQADLRARQLEYNQQKDRLARIEDQIEKCRIYAPRSGMVVYATSVQSGRRGNQEPLEAGQSIRERQELIYLPQAGSMRVEVKIHESSLDKVRVGQPVRVSVDALPGRSYEGRVTRIAPLPDAQSIWLNPDLTVYSTTIQLDGTGEEIRTGMTCRAEIIVDQYDEAVYVPVQSVVRVGRLPVVYLPSREGPVARPVEIGLDNNRMVRVIDGVQPGERVLLAPPLTASSETIARLASLQPDASAENAPSASPGIVTVANASAPDGEPATAEASRQNGSNMSDEQRQQMRQRFEQMTPEQQQQARQRMQQRRQSEEVAQ